MPDQPGVEVRARLLERRCSGAVESVRRPVGLFMLFGKAGDRLLKRTLCGKYSRNSRIDAESLIQRLGEAFENRFKQVVNLL